MKIGLAQINPTVGDIDGNTRLITGAIAKARDAGAEIVALPELAILGYPPKDLLLKHGLVARCERAVQEIAAACTDITAIIGSPRAHNDPTGRGLHNSAALCRGGRIELWYDKRLLPAYDVFDESRYFDPGRQACVFEHRGRLVGLTICEDFWNDDGMFERRLYADDIVSDLLGCGAESVINISASPFVVGKPDFRRQLFGRIASRIHGPIAMVNQVGGNDDLVFDGYSMVLGSDGGLIAAARGFASDLLVVDLPIGERRDFKRDDMADLFEALVLGVGDYMRKCGFKSSIVALSGGLDSAVVAAVARAALGPEAVRGIGLPSRYSSPGSTDDARDLARRLGIRFDLLPIEPAHEALLQLVKPLFDEIGQPPGVAEENIQARLRGNIVMSLSNKTGALLLTTGNKSELAVGYCTLYGDMAGGLAVISDVPKTTVYKLARWMNEHPDRCGVKGPPIPESTITKPPSAELRPDQTDQDTLPPYEILDEIILRYVERCDDVTQVIEATKFDADLVRKICRMIDRNEYKRRQMPVGLKVTGRAFGSGWRMPIAARGV